MAGEPKWEIRSVSAEMRARVGAAAKAQGMNPSAWVIRAIQTALDAQAAPDAMAAELGNLRFDLRRMALAVEEINTLVKARSKTKTK